MLGTAQIDETYKFPTRSRVENSACHKYYKKSEKIRKTARAEKFINEHC